VNGYGRTPARRFLPLRNRPWSGPAAGA